VVAPLASFEVSRVGGRASCRVLHIGTFGDALMTEAREKGWMVINMKNDWKTILPVRRKLSSNHA
jgi:hypothetical protein